MIAGRRHKVAESLQLQGVPACREFASLCAMSPQLHTLCHCGISTVGVSCSVFLFHLSRLHYVSLFCFYPLMANMPPTCFTVFSILFLKLIWFCIFCFFLSFYFSVLNRGSLTSPCSISYWQCKICQVPHSKAAELTFGTLQMFIVQRT